MLDSFRNILRKIPVWVHFQELRREGLYNACQRFLVQKKILNSQPFITQESGEVEIHVLTWRKDYINLIWSLKTFYHLSEIKYPLIIHDGGLYEKHIKILKKHFPNVTIIDRDRANREVSDYLLKNNLVKSNDYRETNVATLKVFDYKFYSKSKKILHIDSDIVFFKKPKELLEYKKSDISVFNKDMDFAYSVTQDELKEITGLDVPTLINSGLFMINADSIDLELIENSLQKSKSLFDNKWVTEQTLHAICAAQNGMEFLSEDYLISTEKFMTDRLVCKHYTGFFRPLFYQEGLRKVIEQKIIKL